MSAASGVGSGSLVDTVPVYSVGGGEGAAGVVLSDLWEARALPDGGLVLVDPMALELRVFNHEGQHMRSFGRAGQGPGEFAGEPSIGFTPPDTLVLFDPSMRRVTWMGMDGTVYRTVGITAGPLPNVFAPGFWFVMPDGTVIFRDPDETGPFAQGTAVRSASPGATSVTTLAVIAHGRVLTVDLGNGRSTAVRSPFDAHRAAVAIGHAAAFVADGERWEVRRHRPDGSVTAIFRPQVSRVPVDAEVREAGLDSVISSAWQVESAAARGSLREAFERLEHPDSVAGIRSIFWDQSGFLWLGHAEVGFHLPRRFEVLTEDGSWVARVTVPWELGRIMDVSYGRIVTGTYDGAGVPRVTVYRAAVLPGGR